MKNYFLLPLICFAFYSISHSQSATKVVYSKFLKDSIPILNATIGELENSDSINLLILLDGEEYFDFAKQVLTFYIEDERISTTILVGLPSTVESRWRHYTPSKAAPFENSNAEDIELFNSSGEFDFFQNFVEKELIPTLIGRIQPRVQKKVMFGHSMGGLGALSFLYKQSTVFNNYIVASPSLLWDDYLILEEMDKLKSLGKRIYTFEKIFITVAENDLPNYADNVDYYIEIMDAVKMTKNCKLISKAYPTESHYTVGLKTLFDGILEVLSR